MRASTAAGPIASDSTGSTYDATLPRPATGNQCSDTANT
jgi:hypothetical protein